MEMHEIVPGIEANWEEKEQRSQAVFIKMLLALQHYFQPTGL